ncbi:hypothetical protein HX805_11730 [Pseudomonas sp. G5001]|uniref:hypothetical protein n=1 Tax=Pseudomonas sp. G5001 TaxID=2738824 RepID=UPI0015A2FFB4|nr:hypothetical protein [Pseudomonas sp. G5001]NWB73140.1 hypothetical protein [Pseudomonas sp. G5001]
MTQGERTNQSPREGHTTTPVTDIFDGSGLGVVVHNTQPETDIGDRSHSSVVAHNTQPGKDIGGCGHSEVLALLLYIDASTNPLPSDYGFIAASVAAQLQHGHVNPLSKE